MTRRLLIDAQLPPSLARNLKDAGFDAVHISELGLLTASDRTLWQVAIERGATIVSKDDDFVTLSLLMKEGPQVIWVRSGNTGNRALWTKLFDALPQITAALDAGDRLIEVR